MNSTVLYPSSTSADAIARTSAPQFIKAARDLPMRRSSTVARDFPVVPVEDQRSTIVFAVLACAVAATLLLGAVALLDFAASHDRPAALATPSSASAAGAR